jgi:hypothetical protein
MFKKLSPLHLSDYRQKIGFRSRFYESPIQDFKKYNLWNGKYFFQEKAGREVKAKFSWIRLGPERARARAFTT